MSSAFLDTGLFPQTGYFYPELSVQWDILLYGFSLLALSVIALHIYRVYKRKTEQRNINQLIRSRYLSRIRSLSLTDIQYGEKASMILRKYLEEKEILERALRKTGQEIRDSKAQKKLDDLTRLLDRGSYGEILTPVERKHIQSELILFFS